LAKNAAKHGILAKSRHLMKITASVISVFPWFLHAKTAVLSAHLTYRNSVCLSVRPSVCHTGGSGKNGPS